MKVEIPYAGASQTAEIDDDRLIGVFSPNEVETCDPGEEISRALNAPLGGVSLEEFIEGGENIVFIVNDGTRPTPTAAVLSKLSERMNLRKARFLVATGTHRPPTDEEYRFIFGPFYDEIYDLIHSHDSIADDMVYLGASRNGTPMEISRMALDADRLIIITSVEPHYFAGYTGGRKSLLPGVASYRTIEANHRLAMSPSAQALILEGNPVHEDMMDALQALRGKKIFSIQAVLDRHHRIYHVVAGDLDRAFRQAVRWSDEVFSVVIPEKAEIVITAASYPMDVDLYQSQKALDNGKWALKDGGVIILLSACREGVGHPAFLTQLSCSKDPLQVLESLDGGYSLGDHKAAKIAELAAKAKIFAVTDLDPRIVETAHMSPFSSLEKALEAAMQIHPDGRVLVLTNGCMTIPKVIHK